MLTLNTRLKQAITLVGCISVAGLTAGPLSANPSVNAIRVEGATLKVLMTDGQTRTGRDLIGAELTLADTGNRQIQIRIKDAEHDPEDPQGRRWLYHLLQRDPATGSWQEFCNPDPIGRRLGYPIEGRVTADGSYEPAQGQISFTCTSGALAKCIRMGYGPWDETKTGGPMIDHFRACLRMVRADYCGDGRPHTRNGTLINVYDKIGVQEPEPLPELVFEAAWGPQGAVCVRKTRIDAVWTLDDLKSFCPARFAGRIGPSCSQSIAVSLPGALIFNESRDTRRP